MREPAAGVVARPARDRDDLSSSNRSRSFFDAFAYALTYFAVISTRADIDNSLPMPRRSPFRGLADILTDTFLRDLHRKLYGDLWMRSGRCCARDVNTGVDPARIAVELRGALDNIRYRRAHVEDWTLRELDIADTLISSASMAS